MKLPVLAALAAIAVGGIAPAHAAADCNNDFKNFFERIQLMSNNKMGGEKLADAMRKGVRAYDACKSGDAFTVHGVFDQLEADKAGKGK